MTEFISFYKTYTLPYLEANRTFDTHQNNLRYIWRTQQDSSVRSEHENRNGKTFYWKDDPKPGMDYNCRCYAEFLDFLGKPLGEYGRAVVTKDKNYKTLSHSVKGLEELRKRK